MTRWPTRLAAALLIAAALALATVGCGSDDAGGEAPSDGTTPTSDGGGPRLVATAFGEVEVPAEPLRVVTLSELALDVASTTGVEPVGVVSTRLSQDVAEYIAPDAEGIPVVGTVGEANLEAVIEADPDLIITPSYYDRAAFDDLSAIAPTVVPEAPPLGDWRTEAVTIADALGTADELDVAMAELDDRIVAVAGEVSGGTATVIRWMPQGPQVLNADLIGGALLAQLGYAPPEVAASLSGPHTDPLSLENLSEIDTDWIFVATLDADGDAALAQAQADPAFERLPANASGQVVVVDGQVWSSATGPKAAGVVLDEMEAALTN